MTQTNIPSFDGTITVKDIQRQALLELEFAKAAKDMGDVDAMQYYKHLADVYHIITNTMMENALTPISDILQLPSIKNKAISLTTSVIKEQLAETTTFIELNTNDAQHTERIKCKIQSQKEQNNIQKFKKDITRIVELSKLEDVDLFALSKKKEALLKNKTANRIPLTNEEEKLLFAKDIKDTIIEMVRNGGRIEAVELIQNYIFKHQNFSNTEANMLVEAVKTHYNIKEPKDKPTIEFTSIDNLPVEQWLKLQYLIKEKTNSDKEKIGAAFGIFNKELGIMDQYGKLICDPEKILYYRPTFKYEEQRIKNIINNL